MTTTKCLSHVADPFAWGFYRTSVRSSPTHRTYKDMFPFAADSSATTAASEEDDSAVIPPQYRRQSSSGRSKLRLAFVEGGGSFQRSASLGHIPQRTEDQAISALRRAWARRGRSKTHPTPAQAVSCIAHAWREKQRSRGQELLTLIQALAEVRQVAALIIQRVWRGNRTRRFVYEEVCVSKITYWEPGMVERTEEELEKVDVKVIGGFTIPAWQREISLRYCRMRRMYVASINVPDGTYPCKFIVEGKYKPCPYLYPTVLGRDGIENSAVALIAHPRKQWWSNRLQRAVPLESGEVTL